MHILDRAVFFTTAKHDFSISVHFYCMEMFVLFGANMQFKLSKFDNAPFHICSLTIQLFFFFLARMRLAWLTSVSFPSIKYKQ